MPNYAHPPQVEGPLREVNGNFEALASNPYFKASERIYWSMQDAGGDIDTTKMRAECRLLPTGACQELTGFQQQNHGSTVLWSIELPANTLPNGFYEFAVHVPDQLDASGEAISLVVVDKGLPDAGPIYYWENFQNKNAQYPPVTHGVNRLLYFKFIDCDHYSVDEKNTTVEIKGPGETDFHSVLNPDYFDWPGGEGRWFSFDFNALTLPLGEYIVRIKVYDKAGNQSSTIDRTLKVVR